MDLVTIIMSLLPAQYAWAGLVLFGLLYANGWLMAAIKPPGAGTKVAAVYAVLNFIAANTGNAKNAVQVEEKAVFSKSPRP
jgi:hypothetical protein